MSTRQGWSMWYWGVAAVAAFAALGCGGSGSTTLSRAGGNLSSQPAERFSFNTINFQNAARTADQVVLHCQFG